MKILKPFLHTSVIALAGLALLVGHGQAQIIEVFGPTVTDLSTFTTVSGDGVDALVSVQGAPGSELLSLLDNTGGDAAEAYFDFVPGGGNILNGFRLDFDVQFNNDAFTTLISDPEVVLRFGNAGTNPTGGFDTGFQLNFRHETDDSTNQFRATNNGASSTNSGLGTSTGFNNVADDTPFSFTVLANNAATAQNYTPFGGGSGTVAPNTYDLFIDGNFIQNYTLGDLETGFDPALGFGSFGFRSSGNSDLGTEVLFDNVFIGINADNGFVTTAAVPEPSSATLLLVGLVGFCSRRRR